MSTSNSITVKSLRESQIGKYNERNFKEYIYIIPYLI